MKFYFIRDFEGYRDLVEIEREQIGAHLDYINQLIPNTERRFYVEGYSKPANRQVNFACDFQYSSGFPNVNWRERLCCPVTGFNNRLRFSLHLIDTFLNLNSGSDIYLMEQVTPLHGYLAKSYRNLVGSEFLGAAVPLGSLGSRGIRNEDVTALTFDDGSFDSVLSYDVLEHVPNFQSAFAECFRVLKTGGRFLFSAPFNPNSQTHLIRATVTGSGEIRHLSEPEYHGDPLGGGVGVLCYQHFGWNVLEDLKTIGFSDAYAIMGWSNEYCYFTPQIQFLAVK